MKKIVYIIDGKNFKTLEEFYDEITKVFSLPDWFGRNLDAFNDILRSEFRPPQGYVIKWINSEISKKNLGYEETIRQLEKRLKNCHPSNKELINIEINNAQNKKGDTVFDWLVEIIKNHSKNGIEADDNVELILK